MNRFLLNMIFLLSLCIAEAQSFQAVIQKGHGEVIKEARFVKGGQFVITVSRDKTAKLWDASTGREMRSFIGHDHTVNGLSLFDDLLATSSADETAIVWDLPTGEKIWQSEQFDGFVSDVAFSPDGKLLAVASFEDSISIYRTKGFILDKRIKVNPDLGVGYGVSLGFSPDRNYLAMGQDNRTALVYETNNWEHRFEFKPSSGYCGGCGTLTAFDEASRYLLKLSNGTTMTKYDVQSGELVWESTREFDDVASVAFSASNERFLASTEDSIFVYENTSGELVAKWGTDEAIEDASFHPSEEQILVAAGKVAILFDINGKEITRFQGILNQSSTGLDYDLGNYWERYIAKWVKYKPAKLLDGEALFVGKTANKARKWKVKDATISMEYIGHEKGVLCFERISEELIATGGGDGKIMIWEEATGKLVKQIDAHRQPVFDLALSHDKKWLASAGWDAVISLWSTADWSRGNYVYNENASAYTLQWSPNDAYLVTGLLDQSLQLWETETKRFVREYVGHTDNVTSISFKGDELLTAGWDGKAIIWDYNTGLIKRKLIADKPLFAASHYGDQVVTAGADRLVTFWDPETGKQQTSWSGHQAEINGMMISGNVMMTSDVDGVTKFWDILQQKELFEHIQIGSKDWMVKTPRGYFDATDQAISNIQFVKGLEVYGSDQLLDQFFKPGLVKDLFSDTRSGKSSIENLLEKSPPPVVKLSGLVDGEVADLFLKVEDKGGGVKDIKLFHNAKRVPFEEHVQKSRSADANSTIYTISYPLVAGINEFSASAASKENVESNVASVSMQSESNVPGSTCHILAVGINEYTNSALNLNYARPDASSFSEQMKSQGSSIYSNVEVYPIFDQEATREGVLSEIKRLKEIVSVNDVFIFYFAGHGSMVDDQFYLVSSNARRLYDNQKMDEFGISASFLQEAMKEIRALKQLIIMDACQSGGSVEILAQRGAPQEKAIAQLSRSTGIHVMASAGSEQYATEFESLGHGLFTYALLRGLSGEADGAPKDGKVTIYELKSYLDDQVPELSIQYKGSPQYPHTFSRGQDFPIVIIE